MIGKLHAWKGEHRATKDLSSKGGVGGFVSLEELAKKPKSQSPAKANKKKAPFLSIARHSLSLNKAAPTDEPSPVALTPPIASDLFSNIPASAGLPPDNFASRPASPVRPGTADPDPSSFARRRSKTAPADTPYLTLDWDKPLPLDIGFDHSRKRSSSNNSARLSPQDSVAAAAASIPRPWTSHSNKSDTTGQTRKRSGSVHSKAAPRPTYSLTPAISPAQSRRPSITQTESRRGSQVAVPPINVAGGALTRQRTNSTSGPLGPPPDRPAPVPSPNRSVLDEVEGTLSATIRELQDLQGSWDENGGLRPASPGMFKVPSAPDVPRSAPPQQSYFMTRAYSENSKPGQNASSASVATSHRTSTTTVAASLPTTPMPAKEEPVKEAPSLGRMQSIQIAYEKQKKAMHKLQLEHDTLKQQLNFTRERLAEMEELRSEKETLEVALQESRTNMEKALTQLHTSKAAEQATQNNLTNVERRLEEANTQKVDILEGYTQFETIIAFLRGQVQSLKVENEELKQRPQMSEVEELRAKLAKAEEENKLLAEQVKDKEGRADLPSVVADLTFKLDDSKRIVTEKDKYIEELETAGQNLCEELEQLRQNQARLSQSSDAMQRSKTSAKRLSMLEKQLVEIERARSAAKQDSDRYQVLLQEQLRRTAIDLHKREHPAGSLLEKKLNVEEAIAEVRAKAEKRLAAREEGEVEDGDSTDLATRITELEREVEYHVKDIVLYKLDVKGYKKDLKKANAKIAALNEAAAAAASKEEARPSFSSQSSGHSVPQMITPVATPVSAIISPRSEGSHRVMSPANEDDKEAVSPGMAVAVPVRTMHIIHALTPNASPRGSPMGTPMRERSSFLTATAT